MLTDLDEEGLWRYRSAYAEPEDFDAFWRETLDETREHELALRIVPVDTPLRTVEVFDVTFAGFGGHPIRAWLRLPRHRTGPLAAVAQFHGYGSGRGSAVEELLWSAAGYAHLLVDVRGQGGAHAGGETGDPVGSGPSFPGFLTRGIEDKHTYVYRRIFADAVRAVEALRAMEFVDPSRVAVAGNSQGAGIALAVAGLVPDLSAAYLQAPFLSDVRRASLLAGTTPYRELAGYLAARRDAVEQTFATLSYFDGVGFARRANAPAWFSAGLMDDICPPSTIFGAFHAYRGEKYMKAWTYNGHEAGGGADLEIALAAFAKRLGNDQ